MKIIPPNDDDRLWSASQQRGWFQFSGPLRFLLLVIVMICLVIGLWYLLSPARRSYETADLPIIHADDTPFKVKAEDQGIPSIKHQDKLVYGRISGDPEEALVEHILPDPETPLDHLNETSPLKMVDQYVPEDKAIENEDISPSPPPAEATLSSIEDLIETLPEDKKTPKNAEKEGVNFIQLGSLKSYDLAEAEWSRLSKKHADIFAGHDPIIQDVDLGENQGIYYRLRIGLASEDKAKKFCASLKERKVECLVIH